MLRFVGPTADSEREMCTVPGIVTLPEYHSFELKKKNFSDRPFDSLRHFDSKHSAYPQIRAVIDDCGFADNITVALETKSNVQDW